MTIPGAGGQVPPRVDQGYAGSSGAVVSPGGGQIVRAREVIVSGANGGVFVYSSAPPALGNLIGSIAGSAGTDPQGNAYLQGTTSYLPGATYSAVNMNGGTLNFYTAPGAAGPWTLAGNLVIALSGSNLVINFTNLSGAINVPQPHIPVSMPISLPPPTTYSQLYTGSIVAAINDTYALLQAANISL